MSRIHEKRTPQCFKKRAVQKAKSKESLSERALRSRREPLIKNDDPESDLFAKVLGAGLCK